MVAYAQKLRQVDCNRFKTNLDCVVGSSLISNGPPGLYLSHGFLTVILAKQPRKGEVSPQDPVMPAAK